MPYATYRFNKIIAAETIRFIVTVAIVVYKGLKLVVYRMLTDNGKKEVVSGVLCGKVLLFTHEYRQKPTLSVVFGNANSAVGHRE